MVKKMKVLEQELQAAVASNNDLKEREDNLTMEKAELVQLLHIKSQYFERLKEDKDASEERIVLIQMIQQLSMHQIRRDGIVDDFTVSSVRQMMDGHTYELFEQQETKINHLTSISQLLV